MLVWDMNEKDLVSASVHSPGDKTPSITGVTRAYEEITPGCSAHGVVRVGVSGAWLVTAEIKETASRRTNTPFIN